MLHEPLWNWGQFNGSGMFLEGWCGKGLVKAAGVLGRWPLAVWLECAFAGVIFQPFHLPPWPL